MNRVAPPAPRARGTRVVRRGDVSLRVSLAAALVAAVAWVLALGVALCAVAVGDYPMRLTDVVTTLAGDGTPITYDIVVRNRLPRALVGLLVGAALGLSGAVFQRIARNPLVSPDVIGINAGASAGAVITIVALGAGSGGVVAGALTGAALATALVYTIAHRGGFSGYRLVLVGIGVTALMNAAASFLLTRSDRHEALRAATWLVGSVAGRSWADVLVVTCALTACVPPVLLLARQLQLLELGDDLARGLGGRVGLVRPVLLSCGVGLAALATAAAGPIAFVALVAPQIVRRVLNARSVGLLPAAGVGALVVAAADLAARRLFGPYELPAGVLTAAVGAPVLLYLLVRVNKIGSGG